MSLRRDAQFDKPHHGELSDKLHHGGSFQPDVALNANWTSNQLPYELLYLHLDLKIHDHIDYKFQHVHKLVHPRHPELTPAHHALR